MESEFSLLAGGRLNETLPYRRTASGLGEQGGHVVAMGMVAIVLFEAVLGGLRAYLFSHTSSPYGANIRTNRIIQSITIGLDGNRNCGIRWRPLGDATYKKARLARAFL